mmetsp:Transcript_8400/g.13625  ORF Transcript_8400/g.13625 Transcript_8400/m.13625 type:complete len:80 (-) Transcript_8400:126-365(-)|eukprot:CAMPEP_0203793912 /NCGR_PEP_ID=MMETSP0100_2-20121128/6156_1 /ASSEMBLY_ACC=CAM_ASM_000210 /TAXON_ID=96639 /ORGANISM=" , Strain NY0313808BC1" /LENGTH=79 /DNA_ID=CAMNT_0050697799 /DNA_START=157 /DNA_END=396 /DNA_ORIENTATION=-
MGKHECCDPDADPEQYEITLCSHQFVDKNGKKRKCKKQAVKKNSITRGKWMCKPCYKQQKQHMVELVAGEATIEDICAH